MWSIPHTAKQPINILKSLDNKLLMGICYMHKDLLIDILWAVVITPLFYFGMVLLLSLDVIRGY